MSTSPTIHRPKPRRPFATTTQLENPSSHLSTSPPSETPSRTHSILNLTSSTLLGIYSPTYDDANTTPSTPWGNGPSTPFGFGAQTPRNQSFSTLPPLRRKSSAPPPQVASKTAMALASSLRGILLFGIGMGYGVLVRHLHDDRQLAPFQVEGIIKPRNDWRYLLFWGTAGVALGSLLPWFDRLFTAEGAIEDESASLRRSVSPGRGQADEKEDTGILGADWTPVIRSIGAFVGIAYAIRKLPWSSTLQASLTLFLVNPVLWYLIDRSKPGFLLSSAVGATGTALLLASNPDMMPSPASFSKSASNSTTKFSASEHMYPGNGSEASWVRRESLEGGIWILSVLFCSCVCFGNIGRRLALSGGGSSRRFVRR